MNALWALTAIAASALSAFAIQRALRPWPDRPTAVISSIVLWMTLLLLPVHILAGLEIVGVLDSLSVPKIAILQLLLLGTVLVSTRRFELLPAARGAREPIPRFLLWSAAVIAGSYAVFLLDAATSYPKGFDALAYHLPLAVRWLQEGSLQIPASSVWQIAQPANAEVPMMLLLSANWQSFVTAFNMLAGILLALSAFALGRRVGLSVPSALASTLILLTIPMVQFQFFGAYIDLFATAFFIAAGSLLVVAREGEPRKLGVFVLLAGLACGIAMGSKLVFLFYGGLFGLAALYVIFQRTSGEPRRRAITVAVFVLALFAPMSFWLWRAFSSTGTPIFPIEVAILGHELLPGVAPTEITGSDYSRNFVGRPVGWLVYAWREHKSTGYPYTYGAGLGASFATFVPLGVMFSAYSSGISGAATTRLRGLIVVIAALGVGWWTLLERVPRFGMPILVLACIAAGWLVQLFLRRRHRVFGYLFLLSIVTTCAISTSVPIVAMSGRLFTGNWARHAQYKMPSLIDDLPAGTRVLHVGEIYHRNFALLGKDLQVEVVSNFESPNRVTREFLQTAGIAFIASRGLEADPVLAPVMSELELIYDADDSGLPPEKRWRIWKVPASMHGSS